MNAQTGFAVVDTETTGMVTEPRHRLAEITIVRADPTGALTSDVTRERDVIAGEVTAACLCAMTPRAC